MSSFEDKIKQAQEIAEKYLKLTDEQQTKIRSEMNSLIYNNLSVHDDQELRKFAKLVSKLTEEQKLDVLNHINQLKQKNRDNSNVTINLKLDIK
ncbi:hypothetical protein CAFE_20730 [Caprobacter fermentans]|uniref:Uncharacterized protein n=1 Tax=Caproicibacter fermentans TaxID=2576756 RepID=A0A6N8I083_9FIRM|nr:DUF3106 domain-containing protein [Caproicibacter fermentans]MVB11359.1 hypothetical protein [Caproicibacter fermentans]